MKTQLDPQHRAAIDSRAHELRQLARANKGEVEKHLERAFRHQDHLGRVAKMQSEAREANAEHDKER